VRVATWNVQHGRRHDDGRPDPVALAAACAGLRADVLALQEVDRGTARVRGADLLAVVADATGLTPVDGPAHPFQGGTYGNALLVAGEPEAIALVGLPRLRHGREPRVVLRCRFAGLLVATCHLDHRGTAPEQLGAVLASLPAAGPAVLTGDLNLEPGAVDAILLAAGPGWSQVEVPLAFPARLPRRAIDHVLVREVPVISVDPPADRPPVSDHRPVVVDLAWPAR
jgi:endonuclease/exonuclease/phosphatase family metal-dependent hydrolase